MPADKVPEFLPISSDTARRWDKKILSKYLPEPDFDNLRIILNRDLILKLLVWIGLGLIRAL